MVDLLDSRDWILLKGFKEKYVQFLRQYYFIGGMPEAVFTFSQQNDFTEVREIQKSILAAFELDFSKYAPADIVSRIRMLWNSVPAQLAKENKKFIYKAIRPGSRAKDYELTLAWLIDCGLAHKVCRVSKPGFPLKAYEDTSAFKLFIVDVGILSAMGNIDSRTMINGNVIFEEFKGALTEQYVLQQLAVLQDIDIYYWSAERSSSEVDFLIQFQNKVFPIEVKSEENLQAKSLKAFFKKYSPPMSIRTSMSDYREENWLVNIPLYAIGKLTEVIS